MGNRQEGLRNPLEIERPFSAELSFSVTGAMLIDSQLIIATGTNYRRKLMLLIVAKRSIQIVRERIIRENGWQSQNRQNQEDQFCVLPFTLSEELGPVYIGDEYKVNYSGLHNGKLTFKLQSTSPILLQPLDRNLSYREVLENLERRRAK